MRFADRKIPLVPLFRDVQFTCNVWLLASDQLKRAALKVDEIMRELDGPVL